MTFDPTENCYTAEDESVKISNNDEVHPNLGAILLLTLDFKAAHPLLLL